MNTDTTAFLARVLRRVGAGTTVAGALGLAGLRAAAPVAAHPLDAFALNALVTAGALVVTLLMAIGLALLVTGLAFGLEGPGPSRAREPAHPSSDT